MRIFSYPPHMIYTFLRRKGIRCHVFCVAISLTVLLLALLSRFLFTEIQLSRERARRVDCASNISGMIFSIANYHERFGEYPSNIVAPDGQALLSWRVDLIRIVDPQLFGRFVITEPWNSDKNIELLDEMPDIFSCPSDPKWRKTPFTSYCLIGNSSLHGLEGLDPIANSSDLVLGECAGSDVPWTKPSDEIAFIAPLTIDSPKAPRISSYHAEGAYVVQLNGEKLFIRRNQP